MAGTAEFNGIDLDIRADRIKPLVNWVNQCFPGVDTRRVEPWAGLRPMMPNMLPRVGAGKKANVFYNTGHGHLGWTLSAITAHQLAGHVMQSMNNAHLASLTPVAAPDHACFTSCLSITRTLKHRRALVMLLDAYAQDPMGGGEGLAQDVKARLCDDLAART